VVSLSSAPGELDLHLFAEGTHRRLWQVLGAHTGVQEGGRGVAFAVWAPHARQVSVVGDFCDWDGRRHPLSPLASSGVWHGFVPGAKPGSLYKYEILTPHGHLRLKTDPFARSMEHPPHTASRVFESRYRWHDEAWCHQRAERDVLRSPLHVYEVHLASWRRHPDGSVLGYRELAEQLADHVLGMGFTHLELLPVMEHPFDGSWGYQVSGYYAPTARFGNPDDFRAFVDHCHERGLGVILDWVPGHFPRDDFALRRFDGEPLFEYADPRLGEHPEWGTLVFDYGRGEVCSFLVSNALYWLQEFHVDGIRVDAVASMLYRDYDRGDAEWLPNCYGGRENLEAVEFVRRLNQAIREDQPGCFSVADESTAWSGVTRPVEEGGLGFTLKWNMGWMHDTLEFFSRDPVHRSFHAHELTFAALYEHSEHFLMPLSHDEVVHGKRSLLEKMPGDEWRKRANLRLLLAYQLTRPGKQLLFMGTELAPFQEWDYRSQLDWSLADQPERRALAEYLATLGRLYHAHPCLWESDSDPDGFAWIDCADSDASIFSYLRCSGDDLLLIVLNATPVPRGGYRIGAPRGGAYQELLCSDALRFGGSGYQTRACVNAEPVSWHSRDRSLCLELPPLGCLVLAPAAEG